MGFSATGAAVGSHCGATQKQACGAR